MRPTGIGSVCETSLVIMGYGGLQKLQAPAVEVGFSDGLDRGGTLEKAGQQCGAQLTQLRPCVKMSLTGRSCRAWCCESEHEKSLLIQLLGEASMDGHLDRLPQILRMIAAIPVVAMPPPLNIS